MSRRVRLLGLAIAVALLANGVANYALAGGGVRKPVKVCEPVKAVPTVPACQPVKPSPLPAVCKPVKPLPPPEACKPVKAYDSVDAHSKRVVVHDHIVRFVSRFKHGVSKEVYYDAPQPAPSVTPATPAPTLPPAPRPATT
jgi:hypothetical protein